MDEIIINRCGTRCGNLRNRLADGAVVFVIILRSRCDDNVRINLANNIGQIFTE